MDNMPDFDSMTPEEMMAWMETLAKRQGATEGLVTSGDMEVPEIDPDTVGELDEPGYIPFGMDPDVWAEKKAREDAERAERIAAMKADRERQAAEAANDSAPAAASSPLDFLQDMAGVPDAPDVSVSAPPPVQDAPEEVDTPEVPLEDLFADLSGAVVPDASGEMDWLADLGQAAGDLPTFDDLDFGSLEALDAPVGEADSNPLEWLESLVSNGDSEPVAAAEADAAGEMYMQQDDILEDSAVSDVLNDPMEWLADFADTQPMNDMAARAANSREVLAASDDLDDFFDRITDSGDAGGTPFDLNQPMGAAIEDAPSGADGADDDASVGAALTQGGEVASEDMKAWMDSLLDRGIQRTDVSDDDGADDGEAEMLSELPSWLIEQVGEPPSQDELLAAGSDDLPDWLTEPVTDTQNAEFEEMFSMTADPAEEPVLDLPELDGEPVAPLDTGVIRVQMDDPWVEAFELERDERLSDTGRLAAWYESAAHEVQAAQRQYEEDASPQPAGEAATASLQPAQLPDDEELPAGEPQSIPTWLGGDVPVPPLASPILTDEVAPQSDEELPDWLRAAQLESDEMAEVPAWLTESLSTDEFEVVASQEQPDVAALQDEPTSPVAVQGSTPISQLPTSELARVRRPARELVAPHEAANVINQARASHKLGDITAMLDAYDRLIRSELVLEDVEADMEKVIRDAVQKTNPAALRVYGDVLLRRGKLQQALDTYRAALNLL